MDKKTEKTYNANMKRFFSEPSSSFNPSIGFLRLLFILFFLSLVEHYDYLLFHTLAEILTVIVGVSVFVVAWNSRRFSSNDLILFIGFGLLTASGLSLLHALSYQGMGVFKDSISANMATQLWLTAEFTCAMTFVLAPLFIERKISPEATVFSFSVLFVLSIFSIIVWKIFPVAYIEGQGLTNFKIYSEYAIIFLFALALFLFRQKRSSLDQRVCHLISTSIALLAISEIFFTLYLGVNDTFNLLGHLIRIAAFYFTYLGLVEFGLMKPYHLIFKNLKDSQVNIRDEKNKVNSILDALNEGVCMIDKNYEIQYANPSITREFGQINGQKCYRYLHNLENVCPWCKNEIVFKGNIVRWEKKFNKNNKFYSLVDSPIRNPDGSIESKIETLRDITEKKVIELAKDEFVSLASHQLRTPLSGISLSAELLLRGSAGQLTAEQKGYLEEIYGSAKGMTDLVANLLNISRLEMGTFIINSSPIEINLSIEKIISEIENLLKKKSIRLEKDFQSAMPKLRFDLFLLRIIIENLLSNAIHYTPPEGKIKIKTRYSNSQFLLEVSDNGCGIPKNQQEKIFSKSFRADNAKKISSEGAGLGLYMIKSVLDKIEGKIWFESKPGQGTTFFVSVPTI